MKPLENRVAIVTGAGSGIGRAIAQRLAINGAAVGVLDRNRPAAFETAQQIESLGGRAVGVEAGVNRARRIVPFSNERTVTLSLMLAMNASSRIVV